MTTFSKEFSDYPASDLPPIPPGFEDSSWHNDSCPSFTNDELGLLLYVDYAKKKDRETPDSPRFSLHKLDAEGCVTDADPVVSAEDWPEISAAIESARNPKIVREFSVAGPCLTLGRLTKETAQFWCYEEWKGGDRFEGAKKIRKRTDSHYSRAHVEPCQSCRDHPQTQYPRGYED